MTGLSLPGGARIELPSRDTQWIIQELRSIRLLVDCQLRLALGFTTEEVVRDMGLVLNVNGPVKSKVLSEIVNRTDYDVEVGASSGGEK